MISLKLVSSITCCDEQQGVFSVCEAICAYNCFLGVLSGMFPCLDNYTMAEVPAKKIDTNVFVILRDVVVLSVFSLL